MFYNCQKLATVRAHFPSFYKIVTVCGGYKVFFSQTDYQIWKQQK